MVEGRNGRKKGCGKGRREGKDSEREEERGRERGLAVLGVNERSASLTSNIKMCTGDAG